MKKELWPVYVLFAALIFVGVYKYNAYYQSETLDADLSELNTQVAPPPPIQTSNNIPAEMVNDEYVLALSSIVVIETMTFNHGEYLQRMQTLQPFFTDETYAELVKLHQDKELEETIKLAQTTVITTAVEPPKISSKFEHEGVKRWEIEFPTHVKYDSAIKKFYETKMVVLQMKTSDNPDHKYGVAIYGLSEGAL